MVAFQTHGRSEGLDGRTSRTALTASNGLQETAAGEAAGHANKQASSDAHARRQHERRGWLRSMAAPTHKTWGRRIGHPCATSSAKPESNSRISTNLRKAASSSFP